MRRALLIYNPKSGRQGSRRLLPGILADLRAGGFEVEAVATAGPGDATRLAREAARLAREAPAGKPSVEVVFVLGGNGTLREAAAGLLGSRVALGPLPAGTANVMALALGLPREARSAARRLPGYTAREIDVGVAGGEPFLMCVSAGLDAAVVAHQDGELKKYLGRLALVAPTVDLWLTYDYPVIRRRIGGREERVSYLAVCNIPYCGGAFRMVPGADCRDGLLDLVLFRGRGRRATLGFMRDLALGRHHRRRDVEVLRAEELEIVDPPGIDLQIDGDVPAVVPPIRIGLARQKLRVLAP